MSKKGANGANGTGNKTGPDTVRTLTVNAQYLKDMSFENPQAPGIFTTLKQVPDINIEAGVTTADAPAIGPNVHEVTLSLNTTARHENNVVFICEVTYAGLFTLADLAPERTRSLLFVDCPNILFPFVRAIICEATQNGGFPPLMLNPVDFNALYQEKNGKTNPT